MKKKSKQLIVEGLYLDLEDLKQSKSDRRNFKNKRIKGGRGGRRKKEKWRERERESYSLHLNLNLNLDKVKLTAGFRLRSMSIPPVTTRKSDGKLACLYFTITYIFTTG